MYIIKSDDEAVDNFAVVLNSTAKVEGDKMLLSSQVNFLEIKSYDEFLKNNANTRVIKIRKGVSSFELPVEKEIKSNISLVIKIISDKYGKMMMLETIKKEGN